MMHLLFKKTTLSFLNVCNLVKLVSGFPTTSKMAAVSVGVKSNLSCFAIRLKPGEELKQSLLNFVETQGLRGAFVLSCVGSVTQAKLRLAGANKRDKNQVRF